MVTKESLEEQYAKLETAQLLEIININSGYTDMAIAVALAVLKHRDVPVESIEDAREAAPVEVDPELLENCLVDLSFFQKFFFYIAWPISAYGSLYRLILRSADQSQLPFRRNGYILKSYQSSFYSLYGFILTMVAMATSTSIGDSAWLVWIGGFGIPYAIDQLFNREKLTKKIERIISERGDFEWD